MVAGGCISDDAAVDPDTTVDLDPGAGIDHPSYPPEGEVVAVQDSEVDDTPAMISPEDDLAAALLDDAATEPADDAGEADVDDSFDGDADLDEVVTSGDAPNEEVTATAATQIPTKIRYVLVIVKENHTFDNYFTGFPGADWATWAYKWNPRTHRDEHFKRPFAPDGTLPTSPSHSHGKALAAYRDGHMDGFSTNPGLTPYMRYRERQIPAYWKYAREFVLADHYFSTSLAPSSPGHEVFWFARSTTIDNPKCHLPGGKGCGVGCASTHETATWFNPTTGVERSVKPCFDLPSLPDHLPAGFDWIDYGGQMAKQIRSQRHVSASHYASASQLLADVKAGTLHNLMIAHLSGGKISEHPPEGPCEGEQFTVDVVNAAMKLPQWKHMAIVVTWDDWGGFYDHVKPKVTRTSDGRIFGNGFRLPLLIISPYAKHGYVLEHRAEQASVPRLVEELWGMKFMSTRNAHARDGIAGSLLDAFDFSQPPRAPLLLPRRTCP
ncbi:MAG: alkaline phosphatase family protein [Acidobacteriota bacterium]